MTVQLKAKTYLHEIRMSATRQAGINVFNAFSEKYQATCPGAYACQEKDRDAILIFYDFPAEHWRYLRATNPIEWTFSTFRPRRRRTKGSGTCRTSPAMMFNLAQSAETHWKRLNGSRTDSSSS